jgi:hypothetical protein
VAPGADAAGTAATTSSASARRLVWGPRPVDQTGGAVRPAARRPLVAGLAAEPEVTAERRHARLARQARADEAGPLIP